MKKPLIEIEKAGFCYREQEVFGDISFHLNKSEMFCIVGPNGCGKTTLLDCILGLQSLNSGRIRLNGRDIGSIQPSEIAKSIAYVPQLHEKTFPYTVKEIVLMGRAAYGSLFSSPSKEDKEIAEAAIETVGLINFIERPYTQLSGGEGQLVMIARALAQKASIILMDEPTSHLDLKHELKILEMVIHLIKDKSISAIMTTHFPNHAFYFENSRIMTQVALMNNKRFISVGEPSEVLNEENIKLLYDIKSKIILVEMNEGSKVKQIIPISTL